MEELNVKLGADGSQLNPELKKSADAFKQYGKSVSETLAKAAVSADRSGVSVKRAGANFQGFSRVLQDAAFGPAAIANNLEGLGRDLQQIKQISKDTGQSIGKTLVQSLVGGGGLNLALGALTLGLSLASFGMSAWTRLFPQNAEEVNKAKKKTLEYIDTLNDVRKAQLQGTQNAQSELTTLKLLYKQYTNANLPLTQRKEAYKQLQQQYPNYFGNLKFEKEASDKTRAAYDKLTTSILASAKARAALDIIVKNSTRQLENEQKINDLEKEKIGLLQKQAKARKLASEQAPSTSLTGASTGNIIAERALYNANKDVEDVQRKINNLKTDSNILTKRNVDLEKSANAEIAKGGALVDLNNDKQTESAKKAIKTTKEWRDLMFAKERDKAFAGLSTQTEIPARNQMADIVLMSQKDRIRQLGESMKVTMQTVAEAYDNWINNIGAGLSGAFSNFFTSILTEGKLTFKSLGNAILSEFAKVIGSAIFKKLLSVFLNFASGGSSGFLKGLFGALGGGSGIPGFAGGVSNFAGGLALVGERGPELVNLPRGSDVFPNGTMFNGGTQVVILNSVLRGNDLALSVERTHRTNSRIG